MAQHQKRNLIKEPKEALRMKYNLCQKLGCLVFLALYSYFRLPVPFIYLNINFKHM
jgi:hypothetical protein